MQMRKPSKIIWQSLSQHKILLGIVLLLSTLTILMQLPLVFITRLLVDSVIPGHQISLLHLIVGGLLLFMVVKGVLDYSYAYVSTLLQERAGMALQLELVRHVNSLGLPYTRETQSGYLAARIITDTNIVANVPTGIVIPFIRDILTIIVSVVFLFFFQWRLLLLVLGVMPAMYMIFHISHQRMRNASRCLQEGMSQVAGRCNEIIASIELVMACHAEDYEEQRLKQFLDHKVRAAMKVVVIGSLTSSTADFVSGIGLLLILEVGGRMIMGGTLTLGSLIAFNALLGYMISPICGIVNIGISMQTALAAADRLTEIISTEPAVRDAENTSDLPRIPTSLVFQDVSYGYSPTKPVLRHLTFTISCNQMVLVVGENGAGKSTLARLIPRFYDPHEGCILLNGIDLRSIQQRELRRVVALVPQTAMMTSGTIRDNICFGLHETSDDELEYASWISTTEELLRRCPDSLETVVGDRGTKLSGGERQRIAIARALIRRPDILILDEAASEVDAICEYELYNRLKDVPWQMTTVIIDHKMTTAKTANNIIVLNQGEIMDCGTHDELMVKSSYYRRLYWCRNPEYDAPRIGSDCDVEEQLFTES